MNSGLICKEDLNYDAYFASIGASWNWRYQNFESQLAYQYQQLWRKEIDDRISNFGKEGNSLQSKLRAQAGLCIHHAPQRFFAR